MRPFSALFLLPLALAGCARMEAEQEKEKPKPEKAFLEKAFIGKPFIRNRVNLPKAQAEAGNGLIDSGVSDEVFLVSP